MRCRYILRGKEEQEAAKTIQKRIRGIQARKRIKRLQVERNRSILVNTEAVERQEEEGGGEQVPQSSIATPACCKHESNSAVYRKIANTSHILHSHFEGRGGDQSEEKHRKEEEDCCVSSDRHR